MIAAWQGGLEGCYWFITVEQWKLVSIGLKTKYNNAHTLAPDIFFLLPPPILTILILLTTVPYTYPCLAWTVEEELPPEQTPISPCELAGRGMPF